MGKTADYFRGAWPDQPVPADCPVWIYYEVDIAQDNVLRSVELFADGSLVRNSIELESRDGSSPISIWHGAYSELAMPGWLEPVAEIEFERLWNLGIDKPYP